MRRILILALIVMAGAATAFGQQKSTNATIDLRIESSIEHIRTSIESVNPELKPTVLQERQLKEYYRQKYMSGRLLKAAESDKKLKKNVESKKVMQLDGILTPAQREALDQSKTKAKQKEKE